MLRVRCVLTILLAVSAVTVTACGQSEEDKAKSSVQDYLSAVRDGDGNKACGLVTAATKKRIERSGRPCPDTISSLNQGAGKTLLTALKDAKVQNVKVNGDTGTAQIKLRGLTQTVSLHKEDGKWKLQSSAIAG
jgi:hypothetical protein